MLDFDQEESHSTDRAQWAIWMHHFPSYDGSGFFEWDRALHLSRIAERTLRAHFFALEDDVSLEGIDLLRELEELQQELARHDGFIRERQVAYWYQVRAQLLRVQPLVERLLQLTPPDSMPPDSTLPA